MKAHEQDQSREISGSRKGLANALGWFSIGLGLAEILIPRTLSRAIGARSLCYFLPALGARELISGVGILSRRRPAGWLWSRVVGDAIDLSILGSAFGSRKADRDRLQASTAAVIGVTILDLICALALSRRTSTREKGIHIARSITVGRSPEELYQFWKNFEHLPRFMPHLESVRQTSDRHSHWEAKAPAGRTVEWDAEMTEDIPNERISWRSLPGADVDNSGTVRFEPGPVGRGTVVRVEMWYRPPAGALGAAVAKLFHKTPDQQIHIDLHRFKQMMETGEIVTTVGQPAGRSRSTSRLYDDFVQS